MAGKKAKKEKDENTKQKNSSLKEGFLTFLVFLLVLFVCFGILFLLIKNDVGGFTTEVLEPAFGHIKALKWLFPKK